MIKLTQLNGNAFYVRPATIKSMWRAEERSVKKWFETIKEPACTWINLGEDDAAVKETPEEIKTLMAAA